MDDDDGANCAAHYLLVSSAGPWDTGGFEGLESAPAQETAVSFWRCSLCGIECGDNAVQAAYVMVLHVGDEGGEVAVGVGPACGGLESLLARCWASWQASQQVSQRATQADVDLSEHAQALRGARVRVALCRGDGSMHCTAARLLLVS